MIYGADFYDGLCSSIEDVKKELVADDTGLPQGTKFSRITVKCQTLGTNSYIAIGSGKSQQFRFTAAGQSMTFIAPTLNGTVIPLDIHNLMVLGDVSSGAGILEISGIRVYES